MHDSFHNLHCYAFSIHSFCTVVRYYTGKAAFLLRDDVFITGGYLLSFSDGGLQYLGCWLDNGGDRDLPSVNAIGNENSVEYCAAYCTERGTCIFG